MPTAVRQRDRKLEYVETDKVIPNEQNPRSKAAFEGEAMENLRRSIRNHGILEPIIVQPYDNGMYLLIEGERRWTVAKQEKIKEVPAIIQNKLDPEEQVPLMFNLHENRVGWDMADQLRAIQNLLKTRPDKTEDEIAEELGMSLATFRNRMQVLGMGAEIVRDITSGKLDYTSALRSHEAANTLAKKRPELTEKLGGKKRVEKQLVKKAKKRGGLSAELMSAKADLADRTHVPDELIERYIETEELGFRDLQRAHKPAADRRQVRDLSKEVRKIEGDLSKFKDIEMPDSTDSLKMLRSALGALMEVAATLERQISDAIIAAETGDAGEAPKPPRRRQTAKSAK